MIAVESAAELSLAVMGGALLMALARAVLGPSTADRVVVLDLVGMLTIGSAAAIAVWSHNPVLLDVTLIVALITFVATVAFARYLEGDE
jgi:multicomponent Na+:H+ antiporter subunit F